MSKLMAETTFWQGVLIALIFGSAIGAFIFWIAYSLQAHMRGPGVGPTIWGLFYLLAWEATYIFIIFMLKSYVGKEKWTQYRTWEFIQIKIFAIPAGFVALCLSYLAWEVLYGLAKSIFRDSLSFTMGAGVVVLVVGYFMLNAWFGKWISTKGDKRKGKRK